MERAFTTSGARYLQLEAADPRHRPPAIVQVVLAQVGDRVAIQIDAQVDWGQG